MIEQERIVESEPHSELITRQGRYAEWWAMLNFQ